MEGVAVPPNGLDELAGLLPGTEGDFDLPTDGVELEEIGSRHEILTDVGDEKIPGVTQQHVLAGLLAEFTRLFSSPPAAFPGDLRRSAHCEQTCAMSGFGNQHLEFNLLGL